MYWEGEESKEVAVNPQNVQWLVNKCSYVLVDGHHRLAALLELRNEGKFDTTYILIQCNTTSAPKYNQQTPTVFGFVHYCAGFKPLPTFVDCVVMGSLTAVEQYIISERVNFTNHNLHVEITLLDKITQVAQIKTYR